MSPELAGLIKEALGPRADLPVEDTKSSKSTLEIPGQPWGLETIQERLQGNMGSTGGLGVRIT